MEINDTPYEDFVRQSIEEEKKLLDSLYIEFKRSNPIKKQILKRRIAQVNQNIEILSSDLAKYHNGLSWLREPSKERDEKAEHLPELAKEETEKPASPAQTAAKGTTAPGQTAPRPSIGRPIIGKPTVAQQQSTPATPTVATPRPTVGTSVARPTIGTPVGTQNTAAKQTPAPQQAPAGATAAQPAAPSRPTIGTPVGAVKRPVIGTPIGSPKPPVAQKPPEKKDTERKSGDSSTQGSQEQQQS